jgi:DivIVA domain-containing protein
MTLLYVLLGALVVGAVAFGVAVLITGSDPGLAPAEPDGSAVPLPTDRPLSERDFPALRFDTGLRGYRMGQVDAALRRAAYDIGYKEELVAVLEAEVAALRAGRTDEADGLRRARLAALGPDAGPAGPAGAGADGEPSGAGGPAGAGADGEPSGAGGPAGAGADGGVSVRPAGSGAAAAEAGRAEGRAGGAGAEADPADVTAGGARAEADPADVTAGKPGAQAGRADAGGAARQDASSAVGGRPGETS